MVEIAETVPNYDCQSAWHGDIRDFRYVDRASGEQFYAFIVNRHDLLFYVRRPGLHRVPGGLAALRAHFGAVRENPRGEWTVRIATASEADALGEFLFGCRLVPRKPSVSLRSVQQPSADVRDEAICAVPGIRVFTASGEPGHRGRQLALSLDGRTTVGVVTSRNGLPGGPKSARYLAASQMANVSGAADL